MKNKANWFLISTIAYFIAYAFPALGSLGGSSSPLFGIHCAIYATYYMFSSPIFFVGNLSNVMVFIIFILKFIKYDKLQYMPMIVKFFLLAFTLITVGIWAVYFGIEDMNIGYYVWSFACFGVVASYLLVPQNKEEFDLDIGNHLIEE